MYLHISWEKFARYHRLEAGFMLVFSYFGDRDASVKVFDETRCQQAAERPRQSCDPQLPSRWPDDGDDASGRRWRGPFPSPSAVRALQPSSPSLVMAPHPIKSEVRFFSSTNRVESDGFYIGRELLKFRLKLGESWLHACAS
jgi:hypothetical protein